MKQSVGRVRRDAQVTEAANLLESIRGALAMRGIALLVAVAPNSPTIIKTTSRGGRGISEEKRNMIFS